MSLDPLWAGFEAAWARQPEKVALRFVRPGLITETVTYHRLLHDVTALAAILRQQGLTRGETVCIDCSDGYPTVLVFLACLHEGSVPSIFTRSSSWSHGTAIHRLASRVDGARFGAAVCSRNDEEALRKELRGRGSSSRVIGVADERDLAACAGEVATISASDPAWIQFSSGTTGTPRGVVLARGAVAMHVKRLAKTMGFGRSGVAVGALPLFHDLGLVIQVVLPLLVGATSVLIPPRLWALRPSSLLWAVHEYRGTMTWMPNFGFAQSTRSSDRELEGIDLSCWELVGNGAEPGDARTIDLFIQRFRTYGLRPEAVRMGYGMAENVVAASLTAGPGKLRNLRLEPGSLAVGRAVPTTNARAAVVMSVGKPCSGTEIIVVDDAGRPVPERTVGEILLRSPCLFTGYLGDPRGTREAFVHGWFRTGDLGFLCGGELYVTDRRKDIIIVGGVKIQPGTIEESVRSVAPDLAAAVVAFGRWNETKGTEDVVVVHGLTRKILVDEQYRLDLRIRQRVKQDLDIALSEVLLVHRRWVVRTTSGKIGRVANREKYEQFKGLSIG